MAMGLGGFGDLRDFDIGLERGAAALRFAVLTRGMRFLRD